MRIETPTPDPSKLLEAFLASGRSERAFADLVGSLNRLVHSAALRRTGHAQLAEEVSQNVFAILARKAPSLRNHPCLEAWAMEATRLEARTVLRSERRRQSKTAAFARETEARPSTPTEPMDSHENWQDALPLLDDALESLPLKDRRLIIERFYREKKFGEIAAATGQTEGACKKRIKRALDKLSALLTARGATLSVTAIASVLGTELARSAPSQAAALMATKALAASSSITATTLIANTFQTMSTTKTTSITAAAVIALTAIPFSQQVADARRMEAEIIATATEGNADARIRTKSSSRMTASVKGARTPSRLLASLKAAKTPREILRDLSSFDSITSELTRQRVARMSDEERAELLAELWRFPCGMDTRNGLLDFIVKSNGNASSEMILDQIIAGGRYQAFTAGSTPDDNMLTLWAKKDPAAAVQWYEKKLASDDLLGGLGDQNFKDLYLHLMSGLIAVDPDRALDAYAETPENLRDVQYGMYFPIVDLGGTYAKRMTEKGDDSGMQRLLALTKGPARQLVVSAAAQAYATAGKPDAALDFVDQHKPEPWKRSDFPSLDYADGYYGRDGYVTHIAQVSTMKLDVDTSLDWMLANISKPEAARMSVMRMVSGQEKAMRWLDRQPSGPVRDAAHASLVWKQTMDAKYDAAAEGTSKIDDPSVRSQMVKIVEDSRQLYKDTGGQRRVFQASDTPKIKF